MSLRKLFCTALPVAAALAVWVAGTPAHAASLALNFDEGVNTKGPFTNPGPAPVDDNYFKVNLDIDPNSLLNVAANFNVNINISANLGVSGATTSPSGNLNIPNQTVAISTTGPAKIQTTPTGSASLTLWDQQVGGFDPGGDGSNPNPGATMPSVLTGADLTNFQTTLVGGSGATVQSNPITITGNGNLDFGSILGLIDLNMPLDLKVVGNAGVGLSNLSFQQTGSGDGLLGAGSPGTPNDQTSNYVTPLGAWGDLSGTGTVGVGGTAELTGSIFGIDISLGNFNLGNLIGSSFNLDSGFPLFGLAKLADLNPGGYNPTNYDDLQFTLGLDTGPDSTLPFSLASAGTATIGTALTLVTNPVVPMTITINVTGTITFGINASLMAKGLSYQLQDSVANVVAPEPGSIILLFLGLAGAVPLALRRRRRRK